MLVTAICIALENGLPVLYRQERVGLGGRIFALYKFRSTKNDAENDGTPRWAARNDDGTGWVGQIIRKWRIDELPQIINVFKGDLSFVGPRPERPFFVDQLAKQIPFYALRHCVKPGITGWAQVRYPYSTSVDDAIEKLQYDFYYLKNGSFLLDLRVLLRTASIAIFGWGEVMSTAVTDRPVISTVIAPSIFAAPGSLLLRIAEFFCTKKSFEQVYSPIIADMWLEYFTALNAGRIWKARWMRLLYTTKFCIVAAQELPKGVIQFVVRMWGGA